MNQIIATPAQLSLVLRSVRKSQALSQVETGRRVGLLQKTVSALENHPESVTIESFFKLLSALELEMQLSLKKSEIDSNLTKADRGEW